MGDAPAAASGGEQGRPGAGVRIRLEEQGSWLWRGIVGMRLCGIRQGDGALPSAPGQDSSATSVGDWWIGQAIERPPAARLKEVVAAGSR